jgi:hypothetical protein
MPSNCPSRRYRRFIAVAPAAVLAACGHAQKAPQTQLQTGFYQHPAGILDAQAPPFANASWAPFTRDAVVAIALREWRLFGQPIDDDPPDTRPEPAPQDKPERQQGLWQRVGEYWWIGEAPGTLEAAFTGKHDAAGNIFPADRDTYYAWSAAFISYVMRIAGAGPRFPYAVSHAAYINEAAAHATNGLTAYPPQAYAPMPGDLICTGRGRAATLKFSDLPTSYSFPSHCDIVVAVKPGQLTVIGGNVDDAVTEKHVPITPQGMLAGPDGVPLDTRYPWFVVLKVNYEDNAPVPMAQTRPVASPSGT